MEEKAQEYEYLTSTLVPRSAPLVRGDGVFVFDQEGNKLLDFCSQTLNLSLGHVHPHVKKCVEAQLEKLWYTSSRFGSDPFLALSQKLVQLAPDGLDCIHLKQCNGADAVETAIKMSRLQTRRSLILVAKGCWHGISLGTMGLAYPEKHWLVSDNHQFAVSAQATLASVLELAKDNPDAAAILIDPLGISNNLFDLGTLQKDLAALRDHCTATGTMLIYDEVQSFGGFLGSPFASTQLPVPDIIIVGKAVGGGFALAGTLCSSELRDILDAASSEYTNGGQPLACSAGLASLEWLSDNEDTVNNNLRGFSDAADELQKALGPGFSVPHIGFIAVLKRDGADTCTEFYARVFRECLRRGVLLRANHGALLIKPPIITTPEQSQMGFLIVADAVRSVEKEFASTSSLSISQAIATNLSTTRHVMKPATRCLPSSYCSNLLASLLNGAAHAEIRSGADQETVSRKLQSLGVDCVEVRACQDGIMYCWVPGKTLEEELASCESSESASYLIMKHHRLLETAHSAGVTVGDRWPANAIVAGDGNVVLIDFDVSWLCSDKNLLMAAEDLWALVQELKSCRSEVRKGLVGTVLALLRPSLTQWSAASLWVALAGIKLFYAEQEDYKEPLVIVSEAVESLNGVYGWSDWYSNTQMQAQRLVRAVSSSFELSASWPPLTINAVACLLADQTDDGDLLLRMVWDHMSASETRPSLVALAEKIRPRRACSLTETSRDKLVVHTSLLQVLNSGGIYCRSHVDALLPTEQLDAIPDMFTRLPDLEGTNSLVRAGTIKSMDTLSTRYVVKRNNPQKPGRFDNEQRSINEILSLVPSLTGGQWLQLRKGFQISLIAPDAVVVMGSTKYSVAKYINGPTLEEVLLAEIRPTRRSDVLQKVLLVLDFLYEHGIIWTDLAPRNIIVPKEGAFVLLDFEKTRFVDAPVSAEARITHCRGPVFSEEFAGVCTQEEIVSVFEKYFFPSSWDLRSEKAIPFPAKREIHDLLEAEGCEGGMYSLGQYNQMERRVLPVRFCYVGKDGRLMRPIDVSFKADHYFGATYDRKMTECFMKASEHDCLDQLLDLVNGMLAVYEAALVSQNFLACTQTGDCPMESRIVCRFIDEFHECSYPDRCLNEWKNKFARLRCFVELSGRRAYDDIPGELYSLVAPAVQKAAKEVVTCSSVPDDRVVLFCAGGLARKELCLGSDVDLIVVHDGLLDEQLKTLSHELEREIKNAVGLQTEICMNVDVSKTEFEVPPENFEDIALARQLYSDTANQGLSATFYELRKEALESVDRAAVRCRLDEGHSSDSPQELVSLFNVALSLATVAGPPLEMHQCRALLAHFKNLEYLQQEFGALPFLEMHSTGMYLLERPIVDWSRSVLVGQRHREKAVQV